MYVQYMDRTTSLQPVRAASALLDAGPSRVALRCAALCCAVLCCVLALPRCELCRIVYSAGPGLHWGWVRLAGAGRGGRAVGR